VDISTALNINVSSSYEILGKRLIFINATMLAIFLVIIIVIVCKTKKITKKMNISKSDSN
jgi:ascorbate-specific PTS system EIIC-type component UlaA